MRIAILAVAGTALAVSACAKGVPVNSEDRVPVASVAVTLPSASLLPGQTERAVATPRDANGVALVDRVVTFQTSAPQVASVNESGLVSAIGAGTATLTATSEGVSGQSAVTVMTPPPVAVATVSVVLSATAVLVGQTAQGGATLRDASGNVLAGRAIAWSSSNTGVATVNASGLVSAQSAGSTNITASSEGRSGSASLSVSVPPPVPVATVTVSPATGSLTAGATLQLSATTKDGSGNVLTGRTIGWSSSNSAVATVNGSGLVSSIAAGTVTITASSEGRTGSSSLTVNAPAPAPVASVTLSPATATVAVGATQQVTATTRDASNNVLSGRSISWSTSNSGVATVSTSGLVRGVASGSATITATSEGVSGRSTITVPVVAPPPPQTAPEPGAGSTVLWQDAFEGTAVSGYATRGDMQLVAGGHVGQALRFLYSDNSYDNLIEKNFATTKDIYIRYWYRMPPTADPTCGDRNGSGMKWFMAWRPDPLPRYTFGVGNDQFGMHDNSSPDMPNSVLQNVATLPSFFSTHDGQWHKYTVHIVTDRGLGDGTGETQLWVDGILVADDSKFNYHHEPTGISLIQFPGTLVRWFSGCDFYIDIDDLAIWHK